MNTKANRLYEAIKKEEFILSKINALNEELGAHLEVVHTAHEELIESFIPNDPDLKIYDFVDGYLMVAYDEFFDYFTSKVISK